jgi:bifunctional oligoribonuclease and PAP phosphatase NrnA
MAELERAAEVLAAADPVLITCHLGPDGDAMGSMIALASMLRAAGKQVTMYNPDLVPRHLKWLPGARTLVHRLPAKKRFAATCVLDCGDAKLLGPSFPGPEVTGTVVALDHHPSGRPFGDVFVCDPSAAAIGVLVARIAVMRGWPIAPDAAVGIYVSLVSDTGFFRYSNTDAEVLALASRLVGECGVEPGAIAERMTEDAPLSRYKLLSAALGGIELAQGGQLAFMTVTGAMIDAAGGSWDDSDGLVNYARALRGVECGVLLTPAKRGGTRVSLRSRGRKIDAGKVCLPLGGGGHKGAAGCTLEMPLDEARAKIEEILAAELGGPATGAGAGTGT